jgi:hypothetical protein
MIARLVGIVAAAVLLGLGALHAYWASGGRWGADVAITKCNGRPIFVPRPSSTLMVSVLLCIEALGLLGRLGTDLAVDRRGLNRLLKPARYKSRGQSRPLSRRD